jgi:hypothetical protein
MLTLGLAATMLESTWLVLGAPDLGQSIMFFNSGIPTLNAGEAVMVLLAWTAILVAVFAMVVSVMHSVARSHLAQEASALARILLTAALVLLVVSAVHRLLPSASVCCGSGPAAIREAIHLAQ